MYYICEYAYTHMITHVYDIYMAKRCVHVYVMYIQNLVPGVPGF